jgi:hypothetical protein
MLKIIFALLIQVAYLQYSTKKELDIVEDFTAEVEFRLEKLSTTWKKRGVLSFSSKHNKKSGATINNEPLTQDDIKNIEKECELKGNYIVRVKAGGHSYFSTLAAVIIF